jgi:hypothetical protein
MKGDCLKHSKADLDNVPQNYQPTESDDMSEEK